MFKKIVLALVLLLGLFAAYVATRPAELRVARSRTMKAPPDVVHAHLSDFHRWSEWSPWEKLDPTMKREVSGPPSGPGAQYFWSGNDQVGEGRMTITDSKPPESVTIRLEFVKPWAATNTTVFDLAPSGAGTNVTWSMTGHNNFMAKAVGVFMDMDALIGADFEKGLANLDAATAARAEAEKAPAPGV
jgi:hypothetical protein